ncbi:MAG: hypothetical protein V3V08_01345 [Nannocystaceae bacterium]
MWRGPALEVLQQRGFERELACLDHLRAPGMSVVEVKAEANQSGADATIEAMRAGPDVIAQATLRTGRWSGRADILLRVSTESALGAWSYEVTDTAMGPEAPALEGPHYQPRGAFEVVVQGTDVSGTGLSQSFAPEPLRGLCRALIEEATDDQLRDVLELLVAGSVDEVATVRSTRFVISQRRGDSYALDTMARAATEMAATRGAVEAIVAGTADFEEARQELSDDILDEYAY